MNEQNAIEQKLKNLTIIVAIGFIVLLIAVIGLYFKGGNVTTRETTDSNNNQTISNENYDVSKFNEVDVDGALALFKDKGTHVLYIGRSDCEYCQQTVPILTLIQEELNYTTDYLAVEMSTIDKDWSYWNQELADLAKKFDKKTELNVSNSEGKTEKKEDTYGNFLLNYGYTPTVIVIKNGKMVDGFFGYKEADNIKSIIEKYMK